VAIGLALVIDLGSPFVSLAPVVLLVGFVWYGRVYLRRAQVPPAAIAA
jgi:hypothetical protein